MGVPEDLADCDGVGPERLTRLVELLDGRAAILRPDAALIERVLQRCGPRTSGGEDFALVSAEPPAVEDDPSEGGASRGGTAPSQDVIIPISEDPSTAETLVQQGRPPVDQDVAEAATEPESPRSVEQQRARMRKRSARRIREGTLIKGYEIGRLLGAGGMGQVYRARQLSLNRDVAFKVLSPRFAANDNFRKRFLREARSAGRFHHHNLISVHDVDESDGLLFFSMDLVIGSSVGDLIDRKGRQDEAWSLGVVRQALEALDYAHNRGVIHRDIKPDNLMITREDVVKLADLGLSRIEDPDLDGNESGVTLSGTMMGTPFYMSPEQSEDAHAADGRSDIYSLGATLYHMVCGCVPYDGDSPVAIVVNASTLPLKFPRHAYPSAPVRKISSRMMAKDPRHRPQNARDCALAVDRAIARLQSPLARLRGPWMILAAILAAVLVLVVLGMVLAQHNQRAAVEIFRERIQETMQAGDYAAAVRSIDMQRRRTPRFSSQLDRLEDQVTVAWNSWAVERTTDRFDVIEDLLMANDIEGASAVLDRLAEEPTLLAPAVRERLAAKREEVRALRHDAIWGDPVSLRRESALPREDLLQGLDLVGDGDQPERTGPNTYRFTGSGRSEPLSFQAALHRGRWGMELTPGADTACLWGLLLANARGRPWCFIGLRGGAIEVQIAREPIQRLGHVRPSQTHLIEFGFTAMDLLVAYGGEQVRIPLADDHPVRLQWSDISASLQVRFLPPTHWFQDH